MNEIRLARMGGIDRGGLVAWMKETIHRAESLSRDGLVRHVIAPAGMAMEILVDDPALAAVYFARLAAGAQPAPPLNRLYVLSGESPAVPAPHWQDADCPAKAFQAIAAKANLRAAYPLIPGFWQFFDTNRRVGIQLAPNRAYLPRWDAAAPLRRHLHWLMEERGGGRLAHAATLGWQGRGLLIPGKGGTGKSSTTLAGLASGLCTAGDDYVAITGGAAPAAHLLYRIVKQDRDGLARIPALSAIFAGRAPNWQKKIEFNPEEVFPDVFAENLNLAAVMLPRIAHAAKPSIAPVAPSMAMLSLMSTNLHQHIGELETGMAFFAEILRRLPCFRIDLAEDAMANGAALREFIEALPR